MPTEIDPAGPGSLHIREITEPDQEEARFWLHLLQRQFPLEEQVPAGSILRLFQAKGRGEAVNSHFLTAHHPESSEPLGMAWIENYPSVESAALWYIAIAPGREGQGYGSDLMGQILHRAFTVEHCRLIVLEVETAEHRSDLSSGNEEERFRQIDQRNRFYMQRHRALKLAGIHYLQQVEDQPAVPMDLLVIFEPSQPPLSAEETFARIKVIFGDSLQQSGPLELSS